MLAHRSKEDFPPNRPQEIGEVDERDPVNNVAPVQPILKQPLPVEVPPRAKLQINQHGQNQKDDGRGCVSFLIHRNEGK